MVIVIHLFIQWSLWPPLCVGGFSDDSVVKNPPAKQETHVYLWGGKVPWRRKWLPTPVSLPGKSHGQRSSAGYRPWGHRELDTTQHQHQHHQRESKDKSWKAWREPLPLASLEPNYSHSWTQKLRIVFSNPVNMGVISFLVIPNLLQIFLLRNASLSHISNSVSSSNQRLPVSIP